MFILFEVGTAAVECALTHLLFEAWFGRRKSLHRKFFVGLLIYFLLICIYTLIPIPPMLRTACAALSFFVICLLLYNTTPLLSVAGAMVNLVVNVVTEYFALVLLEYLGFNMEQIMNAGLERIGYIVIAKLLNIFAILAVTSILGRRQLKLGIAQIAPLCACQVISIGICNIFYKTAAQDPDILSNYILVLLGLMYINVIMILFIENLTLAAKAKQETALIEQNYSLQKKYYESVQKDQTSTHALWHDIKKYVLAIEAIAEAGNEQALQESVELIKNSFAQIGTLVDVGNQEVNVILNNCTQKAKAQDIQVNLDVAIPTELNISAIDLSVMIGNTFDNAIEECSRLEAKDRVISVELKQKNSMLVYAIENPCLLQAEKKAGRIHGYGLQNVQRSVTKYHGTMTTEKEDGKFRVVVRVNTVAECVLC